MSSLESAVGSCAAGLASASCTGLVPMAMIAPRHSMVNSLTCEIEPSSASLLPGTIRARIFNAWMIHPPIPSPKTNNVDIVARGSQGSEPEAKIDPIMSLVAATAGLARSPPIVGRSMTQS